MPMIYLIIVAAAFGASCLTLFSGFGLGTLLIPVFAIFFPVNAAIAMTAIVHLTNNLLKLAIFYRHADKKIVLKFGIPAIAAAFAGAWCLVYFSVQQPLLHYTFLGRQAEITSLKILMAAVMILFALLDALPYSRNLNFKPEWMSFGGILSGFFGGLSGHQGAMRSAFLIRANLSKEAFIGTGVVIACAVDIIRLGIYSARFLPAMTGQYFPLIATAVLSAFAGVFLGNRLLKKMTVHSIQLIVTVFLITIALLLGTGII